MFEHIAQMAPMLISAGLIAGWVAEMVFRADGYGFIQDMVLGLIGSVVVGGTVLVAASSEPGMLAMLLFGCGRRHRRDHRSAGVLALRQTRSMSVIAPLSGFARRARRAPRGHGDAIRWHRGGGRKGARHGDAVHRHHCSRPGPSPLARRGATGREPGPQCIDYAACNREAPQSAKAGTDSPIRGDHVRADRERAGAVTTKSTAFTGKAIESSDPQIHGMEAEGAKDATYQAAYRSCMRRKGF